MTPVVLDAGALIALERGARRTGALLAAVEGEEGALLVPAPVLAQVWCGGGPRQRLLSRALVRPEVEIVGLDELLAMAAGLLLARSGTQDITDAAVCAVAHTRGARVVISSNPDDIGRLAPRLRVLVP